MKCKEVRSDGLGAALENTHFTELAQLFCCGRQQWDEFCSTARDGSGRVALRELSGDDHSCRY